MAMNEWSASKAGRTEAVWSRLAGCYGDSLTRKFGEVPPPEWRSAITELNDYQLQQGMRRLKYSGKPHAPSLPEFVKLCRTIGHTDDVPDVPPMQGMPALPGPAMGRWQIAGNRRLLGHITRRIPQDTNCYGRGPTAAGMKASSTPNADASPEFVRAIGTLVAMKNRWVELMQQSAGPNGVPPDEQNQSWRECMRQAEEIIAAEKAA